MYECGGGSELLKAMSTEKDRVATAEVWLVPDKVSMDRHRRMDEGVTVKGTGNE